MKKVSFPRTSLPIYVVISSTINFIIIFVIYLAFLSIVGRLPDITVMLAVIPLLVLQVAFAVGLGIMCGTLNVFYRDIGHITGVIFQFWFWFTPIVYALEIIPENFKTFYQLNIMAPVIQGYQTIFLHNQFPDWSILYPMVIAAGIVLLIGYLVFKKLDNEMVDEL